MNLATENQSLSKLVIDKIKKGDLKQIFEILMIIPENRTILDINTLSKIIINIEPIKQIKNFSSIYHCCKNMYLAKFKQKDFIFQKKQDSESLYIILNGKVGLYKRSSDEYEAEEVIFLDEGSCFGKLFEWKIRFLPLALQQTLIAILPKRELHKIGIVVNIERQNIIKQVKNSGLIPLDIDEEKIRCISHTFVYNRIPNGNYLLKSGEIPKVIFLILKGMVKKVIQVSEKSKIDQSQLDYNSNSLYMKANFDCMYSTKHYSTGDYFPKDNFNGPTNYSLITECASQIITIPKKALKSIGFQFTSQKPTQNKDNDFYQNQLAKQKQWQKYKENIINDVIQRNRMEKNKRKFFK